MLVALEAVAWDLRRFSKGQTTHYRGYVAAYRARTTETKVVVLDLLEHPFEAARFNRRPFTDHPSPYGQQVIANVVHDAIAPLLPSAP